MLVIPHTYGAGNSGEDNDTEIDSRSLGNPGIHMVSILPYTE